MTSVSISKQLLTKVILSYVLLTVSIMALQVFLSYISVKNEINAELKQLKQTIGVSLSQAIWEMNDPQIDAIGQGLSNMNLVKAVIIINDQGEERYRIGLPKDNSVTSEEFSVNSPIEFDRYFGLYSHLEFNSDTYDSNDKTYNVGSIVILSNNSIVYNAVLSEMMFPMISVFFSIILLSYVIKRLFYNLLTNPLKQLSYDITKINLNDLTQSKLESPSKQRDELSILADSFNLMLGKLTEYKRNLESAQKELVDANELLDKHNVLLEQEVTKKTANLSHAIKELDEQKNELEESEKELRHSLSQLTLAQDQLVQSEKMASLGSLVAGISHEINTPVGIGVTAVTYLIDCISVLKKEIDQKTLTQTKMGNFINDATDSCALLTSNLNRASELIQSFKGIAVDQTSEVVRDVEVVSYLKEVITSLQPKLKRIKHTINIDSEEDLILNCRAGGLSQIFTNLILNSVIHAFDDTEEAIMTFSFHTDTNNFYMTYQDNGSGLDEKSLELLFEPFFTTKRGQGGSGLGTHILYNIVTQSFKGEINAESTPGEGLKYKIIFPINQIS